MRRLLPQEKVMAQLLKAVESYSEFMDTVKACTGLAPYQVALVRLVACGLRDREIGPRLGIAERTVRGYVYNIYGLLDLENRTQLALWALRVGLIRLEDAWAVVEEVQGLSERPVPAQNLRLVRGPDVPTMRERVLKEISAMVDHKKASCCRSCEGKANDLA